jgi:hypothetical protein
MSLRGQGSWAYIYAAPGFFLAIEGALVQMLVLERPWNALLFLVYGRTSQTGQISHSPSSAPRNLASSALLPCEHILEHPLCCPER